METFADLPPWRAPDGLSVDELLRPLLRQECSSPRKGRKALGRRTGAVQDERLHDARKAAKRARYVSEALVPVFGKKAKRMGKAAERVQGVLGDHQDRVLTCRVLAEAGEQAALAGEAGFGWAACAPGSRRPRQTCATTSCGSSGSRSGSRCVAG